MSVGAPARSSWQRRILVALGLMVLVLSAAPASAAPVALELTSATKRQFARIQEQWLRWLSESYQERDDEDPAVEEIVVAVQSFGFSAAPDFARAAAARARTDIRDAKLARARRALDSAQRFAPDLPEIAFVESDLAAAQGDRVDAVRWWLVGWLRNLQRPQGALFFALNIVLWLLAATIISGALFVILLSATRGAEVALRLVERFSGSSPRPVAIALATLVLLWPIVLPPLGLWLLPWWSMLLWSRASRSERVVLVGSWVALGIVPLVLAGHQQLALRQADPLDRALAALERSELNGDLGTALDELSVKLNHDPAVLHLLADLHRRMGQWDLAAGHLRQVSELEPGNADVLVDLGAFSFRKGDFSAAVHFFQQATVADPDNPYAWYDLSQAYSEAYQFDAQRQALEQARKLDPERVTDWIQKPSDDRVALADAGFARLGEIRARLVAAKGTEPSSLGSEQEPGSSSIEAAPVVAGAPRTGVWLTLLTPILFVGLALALGRLIGPRQGGLPEGFTWRQGLGFRLIRVLLPGLPSAEIGEGVAAFGAVWLPIAIALLPAAGALGSSPPLGIDPGGVVVPIAAVALLAVFISRFIWDIRTEG